MIANQQNPFENVGHSFRPRCSKQDTAVEFIIYRIGALLTQTVSYRTLHCGSYIE